MTRYWIVTTIPGERQWLVSETGDSWSVRPLHMTFIPDFPIEGLPVPGQPLSTPVDDYVIMSVEAIGTLEHAS